MRPSKTPLDGLARSPFQRLATLLDGVPPGESPIDLSIGAPRLSPPEWVADVIARNAADWGLYPPNAGTDDYREAVAAWLGRRYNVDADRYDLAARVVATSGSRTALFLIALLVANRRDAAAAPIVLIPDPFYHAYEAAAVFAGAEPRFLPLSADGAPDLDAVDPEDWPRVALIYVCAPSNPAGLTPSGETLRRVLRKARTEGALAVFDECYSEIWRDAPPAGALSACVAEGPGESGDVLDGAAIINSLSKRSSAPGLRCGFVCAAKPLADALAALISRGGAPAPRPIQAACAALWRDEAHVDAARAHYNAAFEAVAPHLPVAPAGFFAWPDVGGDDEALATRLWREAGVKVFPGRYMSHGRAGDGRLRVAVLDNPEIASTAAARIAPLLDAHRQETARHGR